MALFVRAGRTECAISGVGPFSCVTCEKLRGWRESARATFRERRREITVQDGRLDFEVTPMTHGRSDRQIPSCENRVPLGGRISEQRKRNWAAHFWTGDWDGGCDWAGGVRAGRQSASTLWRSIFVRVFYPIFHYYTVPTDLICCDRRRYQDPTPSSGAIIEPAGRSHIFQTIECSSEKGAHDSSWFELGSYIDPRGSPIGDRGSGALIYTPAVGKSSRPRQNYDNSLDFPIQIFENRLQRVTPRRRC